MAKYRAAHIANFILDSADKDGVKDISILKLLKLVYIFFGWFWVIQEEELFTDEIEAWRYGPVIPSIYYELRGSGKKPIKERATLYDPFGDSDPYKPKIEDEDTLETLNIIWVPYKNAPAKHLIALTHKEGTPWWNTYNGDKYQVIPKDLIKNYYDDLAAKYDES